MASLDSNIVAIALPKISVDFSAGFSYLAWVVTGYIIALVALVIFFGKLTDVYGRKRIYIAGFILFGASSALCGLSQSITELIVFRIIQGGSAALFWAVSRPILLDTFPANEISFAFGVNTATSSIGAVIGPVIGGLLVGIDWRLIFYVNIPIAILASALAVRNIQPGVRRMTPGAALKSFNPLNSGLFFLTVSLVMIWLTFYISLVGVLGLVTLALFAVAERRSRNPLLNRELLANKVYVYSLLAAFVLTVGYNGIGFAMSFYFQSVLSLKPGLSGILIAPVSLALGVAGVITGRFFGRLKDGIRLTVLGALFCGLGMVSLGLAVGFEASSWIVEAALFVIGFAGGVYWVPLITTVMRAPKTEVIGVASATLSMFAQVAGGISITVTVALSAYYLPHSLAAQVYSGGLVNLTAAQANLLKEGIEAALLALGGFNFASIPLVLRTMKEQKIVRSVLATQPADSP